MTSRLLDSPSFPSWERYATLIDEALLAFNEDVMYAVQVAESARTLSKKKVYSARKPKIKT